MDPGFYDLQIYSNSFLQKSKLVIDYLKKNEIVEDVHQILQKMTL